MAGKNAGNGFKYAHKKMHLVLAKGRIERFFYFYLFSTSLCKFLNDEKNKTGIIVIVFPVKSVLNRLGSKMGPGFN
jgi:hypothetical protein